MSEPNRKKTFVDPQVQGALVRRLIMHWIGFFVLASLVAFVLQVLSDPFQPISDHLQQVWWTQGPFLLAALFLLPVFVLDTIKLSHRFVGPINRLQCTIRSIADGNMPTKLKFRDFDFWQSLADDFNQMIDRLRSDGNSCEEAADEDEPAAV
ncbi:hypothetical protein [Bythopirellula polymerisocia]|uniref:HAMP domain-containing protein n=1 Tax=Bythopirellula polymerisocia TaxID=2528003 RepID=A0A5C6CY79_9BACT|nr:hypothetical protein [Bythopirellula polymerisocia]TWU29893.1 hypothetical protein Pla144_06730 [Bythopirellula polymerisocia]